MTDIRQTTQQLNNTINRLIQNKNDPQTVEQVAQELKEQIEQLTQEMQNQ